MRLGAYPARLVPGDARARGIRRREVVYERHRHRFEFNNAFRDELTRAGLVISGVVARRPSWLRWSSCRRACIRGTLPRRRIPSSRAVPPSPSRSSASLCVRRLGCNEGIDRLAVYAQKRCRRLGERVTSTSHHQQPVSPRADGSARGGCPFCDPAGNRRCASIWTTCPWSAGFPTILSTATGATLPPMVAFMAERGKVRADDVTRSDIEAFVAERRTRVAIRTHPLSGRFRPSKGFTASWCARGRAQTHPAASGAALPKKAEHLPDVISIDEARTLLEQVFPATATGARGPCNS